MKLGVGKDLIIRLKRDLRARRFTFSDLLQVMHAMSTSELHRPDMPLATDFDFQPFGARIDCCDTNTMETARTSLVTTLPIKLATCVNLREDDFESRLPTLIGHHSHRNTTTIIKHRRTAVSIDLHGNRACETVDSLVDRVVHNFKD